MLDGKVVQKNNSKKQLYCRPCLTRRDNICCQQVLKQTALQVTELAKRSNIFIN